MLLFLHYLLQSFCTLCLRYKVLSSTSRLTTIFFKNDQCCKLFFKVMFSSLLLKSIPVFHMFYFFWYFKFGMLCFAVCSLVTSRLQILASAVRRLTSYSKTRSLSATKCATQPFISSSSSSLLSLLTLSNKAKSHPQ